ncbi:MarR family transcriptional regulator [Saliphagus sp. GCM10025308]|uniref:MarR family transcriptional regulator n=1 Tax=Natronosalvus caseinilyticus TaxID=2953747 RepID=UPI0028AB545F|nr:helix-turn-helix domain-containing protein [Natronosalvus caseinilyticus]
MSVTDTEHTSDESTQSTLVSDLPPSAKLVYKVLEYEGAMTQEEIATESRLCARTVRYALTKLENVDCVDSRPSLRDARRSIYTVDGEL